MSHSMNDADPTDHLKNMANPLLESGLFKSRTILITGEINDRVARATSERLLAMAGESPLPP